MPITITKESIAIISRLIRKEFDNIDPSTDYIYQKSDRLINTAREFGLKSLALELENDKNI